MSAAKVQPVVINTDGSCKGNPGPGGWAAIIQCGEVETILTGGESHTTNNRMELIGPLQAILSMKSDVPMIIRSDSEYVIKGMNTWVAGWIKNGWRGSNGKAVKNPDLWKQLVAAAEGRSIKWEWVRGHADDMMNIRCDALAEEAAEKARSDHQQQAPQL